MYNGVFLTCSWCQARACACCSVMAAVASRFSLKLHGFVHVACVDTVTVFASCAAVLLLLTGEATKSSCLERCCDC